MLILFLNVNSYINAQNYYNDTIIFSGKEKYICKPYGNNNRVTINNVNNRLTNERMIYPKGLQQYNIDSDLAKKKIKSIISEVMVNATKSKPAGNDYVLLMFWINDSGQVKELNFSMFKYTSFNPCYLPEVEQRIKNEVVFSFTDNTWKGANFIRFGLTFYL